MLGIFYAAHKFTVFSLVYAPTIQKFPRLRRESHYISPCVVPSSLIFFACGGLKYNICKYTAEHAVQQPAVGAQCFQVRWVWPAAGAKKIRCYACGTRFVRQNPPCAIVKAQNFRLRRSGTAHIFYLRGIRHGKNSMNLISNLVKCKEGTLWILVVVDSLTN